ncbi:MAG TPA: hypothetical protein PLT86_08670 [Candidatus Latescibacteria bacterium]|nr:hypothetical protein [Candidatus Latescibacterota bacterium]HQE61057.1 hypothetical protein [Candidatus Latescibacterota bacterium]HQI77115.1 hypothetical protein [Candidatus Latescibacterota bacterium]HQK21461.1 hypothetical protein [Candidatus Latescibacterota bacterium]
MRRTWCVAGMIAALGVCALSTGVHAANPDTSRSAKSAAMLMRLARAQQLSARPRTFQTQQGVAVAARRHADAMEQQKRTLAILNNQYLRGTAATSPSESDVRQTIGVLEQQLNAPTPPENAYEIRYYLAACYESLDNIPKAKELLQTIVAQYGSSTDDVVKGFVEQARADLARLGS